MFNSKRVIIDSTNACTLKCNKCARQNTEDWGNFKRKLHNIDMENFKKLADYFDQVSFCGAFGDIIFNPLAGDYLEYCYKVGTKPFVCTSASHRSREWYQEIFKKNPDAHWIFGIDGLPKDSHKYRINQDGEYLFEIMVMAKEMGMNVSWQYIIFKYNQDDMEEAKELADKHGLELYFQKSKRWESADDPLMPDFKYINSDRLYQIGDDLEPKCLNGTRMAYTAQGYLMPCVWLAKYDVEQKFPEICNEFTKLENVDKVEDILESKQWKHFHHKLTKKPERVYSLCWKDCRSCIDTPAKAGCAGIIKTK